MSGLFGVVSRKNCVEDLFYGTDYQSHLGTERAGLAVMNHRIYRSIHNISTSQFKSKFGAELSQMKGPMGIGVISDSDPQPITIFSSFGTFAVATSGFLKNQNLLAREIITKGGSLSELSNGKLNSTEIAGKMMAQKKNLIEGIKFLLEKVQGSLCLLVLTPEGIYAARDKLGRTTLVIGKKDGGNTAVTSETCAFPNLGYQILKELAPGEVILLTKDNRCQQKNVGATTGKTCAFLWIYTGYPASAYEGISVEMVRERCGANLAKNDNIKADFVTGIPDSGIAHALGYAMASGLPYRRALVKYTPGYGRSYTPPTQTVRNQIAQMKLIPVKDVVKGKQIIICDDSIVRGTQLRSQAVEKLWQCGAKEIHARIACPPLMFPCPYLLSTRTKKELASRRAIRGLIGKKSNKLLMEDFFNHKSGKYSAMVEKIRKELGVTSLKYQDVESMVKAIGLPKDRLCLFCWNGRG